jgi:hypothetical protein
MKSSLSQSLSQSFFSFEKSKVSRSSAPFVFTVAYHLSVQKIKGIREEKTPVFLETLLSMPNLVVFTIL